MKNVMVRDIDDETYSWLENRAVKEQRTVPGEIRHLLDLARVAERSQDESAAAFRRIEARRRRQRTANVSSTELLREERAH